MTVRFSAPAALVSLTVLVAATALSGCAGSPGETTGALPEVPKPDPVCSQLAAQIDQLRREGVHTKIENAAVKKYKMTPADLAKAAQLNRANDDFQMRCSKAPRGAPTAVPAAPAVAPVKSVPAKTAALAPAAPVIPDATARAAAEAAMAERAAARKAAAAAAATPPIAGDN